MRKNILTIYKKELKDTIRDRRTVVAMVLIGVYDSGHILLTLGSLVIYSFLAIITATKIYSKESVLFRD